jgi:signal recognition particle subunit SRP54
VLDGKRKRRIASGSGTKPEDINRVIKMHRQMADVMKMMSKNPGMMQKMAGAMGFGGMPKGGAPSAAELEAMKKELATLDPKALEQLPPELRDTLNTLPSAKPSSAAPSLPGLGGARFPGLPGLGGPRLPGSGFPFGGKKK